jgi:hypothetical protein
MLTTPTSLPENTRPRCTIELYQDPNGNWFAGVEWCFESGQMAKLALGYTGTYTDLREAAFAALDLGDRLAGR